MLGNMCMAIVCFQGCGIINFEINLTFAIKLFFYATKKSRKKFTERENEKKFQGKIKSIFHNFKGLSVALNFL